MDESALERYFDKFIANDSSKMEEEEEEADEEEKMIDEFCSLLPDELLTLYKDDTAELQGGSSMLAVDRPTTPVIQQPQIIPQIENIISTVTLGCSLDLEFISRKAWNVEYKPMKFKALVMRIRKPRITAKIFKSGIIVLLGAKSIEDSRQGARKCARKVQKLGFPVRFLNFKIKNMQASCSTFPVSLEKLSFHRHCSYEPELFPGLFYSGVPGISVVIFATGKISITGAQNEAKLYEALDDIVSILSCYRR
ncbi:uncharacterized protein LOC131959100 isoform X2 [Centropristis striata]|uniref:uncharacterized protein LOC131959100 isoform X2 n=1 Tax=Centropristis striata TaxID=184440 RepID=UPI0027E117B0|nr:uncharacterized protein LOC131959100 isoform X2 [Centropristis striata]